MAAHDERPWAEHEKVTLLSEMLKAAPIRSEVLMSLVQKHKIEPRWDEMPLPTGRSLSSCKLAFNSLAGRTGSIYDVLDPPVGHRPDKKRLYPYDAVVGSGMTSSSPTTSGRPLHPRPPIHQMAESIPRPMVYRQSAPGILEKQQQVKRKRGRPSKAETEAKVAEAAARGEIYYPQSRKAQRPVPVGGALAPIPMASGPSHAAPPPPVSITSSDASVAHRGMSLEARPDSSSALELAERDVLMAEPGDRPSASSSQPDRDLRKGSPREPALDIIRGSLKESAPRHHSDPAREESIESESERRHEQPREQSQERYRQRAQEQSPDQRQDSLSYRVPQSSHDKSTTEGSTLK